MTAAPAKAVKAVNPLESPQWHRVAAWRPRLHAQVRISRLWIRGQCWHVLRDELSGRSCRLNTAAYEIAARLDGQATLQTLWAFLDTRERAPGHADPPTQDEVIDVVRLLQRQGLLAYDQMPDLDPMPAAATVDEPVAPGAKPEGNSLLAWRMPLGNPSRLLDRLAPWTPLLLSRRGALAWGLLMALLALGLILHAPALQAHARTWLPTPRYLLLAALAYPFIKALHELAHALAVRRWGGQVREAGITWMMLMPIPYVDASDAHGFAHAWQRMLVSAAGIMAELALAAVGLWVWRLCGPGLAQDLGFVVWFTAGVSTLLFNANPLQRLDGYHVLTDALALPNLATRSRQWWVRRLQGWLAGQEDSSASGDQAPQAEGERPWLVAYAPLSWAYQVLLWAALTWWVGSLSAVLGWALGGITMWQLVIAPAVRWGRLGWQTLLWTPPGSPRRMAGMRRAALAVGLPAVLVLMPWPDSTVVQGLVWAPDQALLRPEVDGQVVRVHAAEGATVRRGQLLVTLQNLKLMAERDKTRALLAQAEHNQFTHLGSDSGKAGQAGDEVQRLSARLARLDEQAAGLEVRALRDGQLVLPRAVDLPGRYLKRGTLIGHVMPPDEAPTVRVAVHEADAPGLRKGLRSVSVRPGDPRAQARAATLSRDSLGAVGTLPSAALSQDMGGDIITDPADTEHRRVLRPVVLMDVRLARAPTAAGTDGLWLGARAWVRFDRGWRPLAWQGLRWLRLRLDQSFNPSR